MKLKNHYQTIHKKDSRFKAGDLINYAAVSMMKKMTNLTDASLDFRLAHGHWNYRAIAC